MRKRFDAIDAPALDASQPEALAAVLQSSHALHPTLVLRPITTNVVSIWQALADDVEVPEAQALPRPATLAVWRHGLETHFRTLVDGEAAVLCAMAAGECLADVADRSGGTPSLPEPAVLAGWLTRWRDDGLLAVPQPALSPA